MVNTGRTLAGKSLLARAPGGTIRVEKWATVDARRTEMSRQDQAFPGHDRSRARRGRGVRLLPALGAFTLVGLSLCASQTSLRPAKGPDQPAQAKGSGQ